MPCTNYKILWCTLRDCMPMKPSRNVARWSCLVLLRSLLLPLLPAMHHAKPPAKNTLRIGCKPEPTNCPMTMRHPALEFRAQMHDYQIYFAEKCHHLLSWQTSHKRAEPFCADLKHAKSRCLKWVVQGVTSRILCGIGCIGSFRGAGLKARWAGGVHHIRKDLGPQSHDVFETRK